VREKGGWRHLFGRVGISLFLVDALAYLFRCLMHKGFYEGHYSAMVICAESGFIVSFIAPILALFGHLKGWSIFILIGSVVLAYLWFSDIAWWVMVK
jgi:hypothetical protein